MIYSVLLDCKWEKYIESWDLLGEPSLRLPDQPIYKYPHKQKFDEF